MFKEKPATSTTTPDAIGNAEVLTPIPGDEIMEPAAPRRPAKGTPTYKLRQYLADLDLKAKYPQLHPKWRRRMPGKSEPRNVPNEHGTFHAAPRGKPRN